MGQIAGIALIWFIIEMLVWYLIAQSISGWYVFFWFIIAGIIGLSLIRKGMATLNPMASQMKAGGMHDPSMRPNESSMVKTVARAIAGLLFLIPGVLSDVLALLLLLPPVQKLVQKKSTNYAMKNQERIMAMMSNQMGGQSPFGSPTGQNPFDNMGGQSPFGNPTGQNPFEGMGGMGSSMGANNPFGNQPKVIDGTAKTIIKDAKEIKPANDD